jgi:hypothetical protein
MSLFITSALVAGGILAGRFVARAMRAGVAKPDQDEEAKNEEKKRNDDRRNAEADEADEAKDKDDDASVDAKAASVDAKKKSSKAKPAGDDEDVFDGFPCQLGDVVMGVGGDEAWLAGALVLSEETPTAVLFIAPDAGGDHALWVRRSTTSDILWMRPIPAGEIHVGAEPPSSLEHAGERYERVRRLPLHVERHGTGAPDVGDQVVVAEYKSLPGTKLLVMVGPGGTRAWHGMSLEHGMYDVLASGKSTLE